MSLYFLSGVEDEMLIDDAGDEIGKRRRRRRRAARKARKAARKTKRRTRKAVRKQKRAGKKLVRKQRRAVRKVKRRRRIAKVAAFPARAAFLAAVRINFMNLARRLAKGWQKNPATIKNFWAKWGGKPDKLRNTISKGAKVRLSAAPAAAVTFAAAAPIIIALIPLLKRLGVSSSKDQREDQEATGEMLDELETNPQYDKGTASVDDDFTSGKVETGPAADDDEDKDEDKKGMPKWLIPAAGAGLLAVVLLRK